MASTCPICGTRHAGWGDDAIDAAVCDACRDTQANVVAIERKKEEDPMNQTANGTGLVITETDSEGSETFAMSPELFNDSYLAHLLVFSRDVQDETLGNTRYLSFVEENPHTISTRGLVTVIVRTADGSDFPTTHEEPATMNQTQTARIDTIVRDADLLHCAHAKLRNDNAEVLARLNEVSWQVRKAHEAEQAGQRFEQCIVGADVACESGWAAYAQARKEEEGASTYQYQPHHDAIVTADDIRQDASFSAAEYHADYDVCPLCGDSYAKDGTALCPDCHAEQADKDLAPATREEPSWPPIDMTSVKKALAGIGLALTCLLIPAGASATEYPHESPAFDTLPASCEIVKEDYDDGSQVAWCPVTGETYVFDPDGQMDENTAGVPIRTPGWYPLDSARSSRPMRQEGTSP